MSSEFAWLTIEQVAPLIAKRKLSPRELLASLYFARQLRSRNHHFRLGRPREYYFDHLSSDVANGLEKVTSRFEQAGSEIREVRLPDLQQAAARCTAFAYAEATIVHRRMGYFPAREQEYGDDVLHRLKLGAEVRAVDYTAAAEAKRVLQAELDAALANVDAILAPTVPLGATVIGQKTVIIGSREEAVRSAFIRLNRPANITGLPSITVPCGFTSDGLPMGLQLIGRAFCEAQLLQIARLYAESSDRKNVRPTAIQVSVRVDEQAVTRGAG
ncbi:MAG: amidase family protein [Vicinamibacterales bacterium]